MKKIEILYLGNNLVDKTKYQTSLTLLSELLGVEYGIKIYSNKANRVFRLFDMCYRLIRNSKKTDFLLIDTFSTSAFYFAYITSQIARFLGVRYIPILHGGALPNRLDNSSRLCRQIFKNSYQNIAPSGYLKYEFEKRGYLTKLIPNVLDIAKYKFTERAKISPKILYVRAFDKIYNPQMAIYVLLEIIKTYPNAKLCMVGPDRDGSLSGVMELISKHDLNKYVEITGVLSKEEWHLKSEDFDIFINTTNFDNTPISVMEAMALGLPIVSTNVGGLPYLLEDKKDAFLVEKNDVNAMKSAILTLLSQEAKVVAITKNARNKVEGFDWRYIKKEWGNLFCSL